MKYLSSIYLVLIGSNLFVWYWIFSGSAPSDLNLYFLDVGQGDSQLIKLPGGIKVLIDGGPGKAVLGELARVLPATDRYIDLVILSHPQLDHFTGLISVMERYKIGAFIYNGRDGEAAPWQDLKRVLAEKKINVLILAEGDKIKYSGNEFDFLSPSEELLGSKELNDTCLVPRLMSEGARILLACDIGFKVEDYLEKNYDINVDVLKVAHHGSKYSSSQSFLAKATPAVSVIQVGRNRYGHPTPKALSRLTSVESSIYRNDLNGTVHLKIKDGVLNVFTER